MKIKLLLITMIALSFAGSNVLAAGSSPVKPAVSKDIRYYNDGVNLMLDKKFTQAEGQFRKALDRNEGLAEAHNNLAYTLRKQGASHFDEALVHYNRAIELKPNMPEPYMYRGVLYVQMGNTGLAEEDHRKLVELNSPLADELSYVIDNGREKEPEQFFGVSRRLD